MQHDIDYVPPGTRMFSHGIRPERVLTTKERGMVRTRFMEWARRHKVDLEHLPDLKRDDFIEVRWNDGFDHLHVSKTSGLTSYGFATMYDEHAPVEEGEHWATYTSANPAARAMLNAIRETTDPFREPAS